MTDDDELVLDPSNPLLTSLVADDAESVYSLSNTGTREIVRHAWVRLDEDGDAVPAVVPTGMRNYFRLGDVDAGSLVKVRDVGAGYEVASRPVDSDELFADRATIHERLYVEGTIDIDGTMSADDQPSLSRYRTTDVNIPASTWTLLAFPATGSGDQGFTSTGSNTFTPSVSGTYTFNVQVCWETQPAGGDSSA